MNTSKANFIRGFARHIFIVSILASTLVGCDFDPATDHVNSGTKPENIYHDKVWWIPLKMTGAADEWFYIPEPAAVATGNLQLRQAQATDVLVNGKVWRCTKDANNSINYQGPIDPPEVPPTPGEICIWILCATFGVAGMASFFSVSGVLQQAKQTADNTKAKEREIAAKQQRQSEALKQSRQEQRREEKRHAEENEALQRDRAEFEQQKNTHMAAIRESKIERKPPTQEEWKTLSEAIRAHQFRGQATGHGLVVDYFFDPETSGAILFVWQVTWDRPYAPAIVVTRDGTQIRRETGMFKGEFGSQLLKHKRRYKFTFTLFDGNRELPNPLLIELTLPPFNAWRPEPPKPVTAEERRAKREAKRREKYQYAEALIIDPKKLKEKRADIDREILEEFGEE